MSEQLANEQSGRAGLDGPNEDDTTLAAGVPGPTGTGEMTTAGADPAAPHAAAQTTTDKEQA